MRYRRSRQASLVQYAIFFNTSNFQRLVSVRLRSASRRLSVPLARLSISVMRKQSHFSCCGESHDGQMNYPTRSIRENRERSNRSRFFAGTYLVHDPLNEPSRNRYFFFSPFRPTESLLNKTLTLTTIREIANHSKSSLRDSFIHSIILCRYG